MLWRGCAQGGFTSQHWRVPRFDRAVMSWNCDGPADYALEVNGTRHCMGHWASRPRSEKTSAVDIDLLKLDTPSTSLRFHIRAKATTTTLVAVAHWKDGQKRRYAARASPAWGITLGVPERSQPNRHVCSPTSVGMVLRFYGVNRTTAEVSAAVYDHAARIYGNWPFNTAYAHRAAGLETFVRRGSGLEDLEEEIAAGRPVIISHKWSPGDLDDAPLPRSDGHLIVVVGFTAEGDVVVNDPAGRPGAVRRVHRRRQLYRTWLERGQGIMYVFCPPAGGSGTPAQG